MSRPVIETNAMIMQLVFENSKAWKAPGLSLSGLFAELKLIHLLKSFFSSSLTLSVMNDPSHRCRVMQLGNIALSLLACLKMKYSGCFYLVSAITFGVINTPTRRFILVASFSAMPNTFWNTSPCSSGLDKTKRTRVLSPTFSTILSML